MSTSISTVLYNTHGIHLVYTIVLLGKPLLFLAAIGQHDKWYPAAMLQSPGLYFLCYCLLLIDLLTLPFSCTHAIWCQLQKDTHCCKQLASVWYQPWQHCSPQLQFKTSTIQHVHGTETVPCQLGNPQLLAGQLQIIIICTWRSISHVVAVLCLYYLALSKSICWWALCLRKKSLAYS